MKSRFLLIAISAALAFGLSSAQEAVTPPPEALLVTPDAPATPRLALWRLGTLLEQGIDTVGTPVVVDVFADLRLAIANTGDALEVLAVVIDPVEQALVAEPFDVAALISALQDLSLEMRAAAGPGDDSLMVEVASLIDQTAQLIEGEGFIPRMEVEVP